MLDQLWHWHSPVGVRKGSGEKKRDQPKRKSYIVSMLRHESYNAETGCNED